MKRNRLEDTDMRVRLKLKPGQRGTINLLQQYGPKLFCVRYRYDEKTRKRYTTVELIVSEKPWRREPAPDTITHVRIDYDETELREKVKNTGGSWSKSSKTWKMPFKTVKMLGLKKRIVREEK